jgi:hypothetical protein
MDEVQIMLRPATAEGRLIYRHDPEVAAYLMSLKSPQFMQATYFLELEDPVLFRLDANRILGKVKIVIPRRAWTIAPARAIPEASMHANVEFSHATIQQGSFDLTADVTTDAAYSYAVITWGRPEYATMWVGLSSSCWALVADDRFKGLFVRLQE